MFPNCTVGAAIVRQVFEEGFTVDEYKDVKCIWHSISYPDSLGCHGKQVRTLEDWKGLRIAVRGTPEPESIKALGAIPVSMPPGEQYIALERGTVDASWLCPLGQVCWKFYEVAKYQTKVSGNAPTETFIMNWDSYNKLPPDIQEVIDRNSGMGWSLMCGKHFDLGMDNGFPYLEKSIVEAGYPPIYYPTPEELARLQKAWEPVYEEKVAELEAKGYPAGKMLDRVRELIERYTTYTLGGLTPP